MSDRKVMVGDVNSKGVMVHQQFRPGDRLVDPLGNPIGTGGSTATFFSYEGVGEGTTVELEHGLGKVPSIVLISAYNTITAREYEIREREHTDRVLTFSVTDKVAYKIIAIAF
jgi:hypothetical protein